jgi:MFS family permease
MPPTRHGPWSPLRLRVFRALWIAALVSNLGSFMHIAAAGWAMTDLTTSTALVGLVQTAWGVPGFLLALHAGAFADLFDRRRLIIVTEALALVIAGALALLDWAGEMSTDLLLLGTFFESLAITASVPAFMAIMPLLVDEERLPQALGLDAISRNIAQSFGPALAGLIIAASGPGAVFAVNALSFVGVMLVVSRQRWLGRTEPVSSGTGFGQVNRAIAHGVGVAARDRVLRNPLVRLAVVVGATSSVGALLPVLAKDELGQSAVGFGVMSGALGVGAVAAMQLLPSARERWNLETIALVSSLVWGLGALVVAEAGNLALAIVGLIVAGAGAMAVLNVLFSHLLVNLSDDLRGRGSSLGMLMAWVGGSIGPYLWGVVAHGTSVRGAIVVSAATTVVAAVIGRSALPLEHRPTPLTHP